MTDMHLATPLSARIASDAESETRQQCKAKHCAEILCDSVMLADCDYASRCSCI